MDLSGPGIDVKLKERKKEEAHHCCCMTKLEKKHWPPIFFFQFCDVATLAIIRKEIVTFSYR